MHSLVAAIVAMTLVQNDFKYMHLYSRDDDFDKSHKLMDEYHRRLGYHLDELQEMAIELGALVPNPTNSLSLMPTYTPEQATAYSYQQITQIAVVKVRLMLDTLKAAYSSPDLTPSMKSHMDEIMREWEVELNYKLAARNNTITIGGVQFNNYGTDNATALLAING